MANSKPGGKNRGLYCGKYPFVETSFCAAVQSYSSAMVFVYVHVQCTVRAIIAALCIEINQCCHSCRRLFPHFDGCFGSFIQLKLHVITLRFVSKNGYYAYHIIPRNKQFFMCNNEIL
jgi:hypothetical protein